MLYFHSKIAAMLVIALANSMPARSLAEDDSSDLDRETTESLAWVTDKGANSQPIGPGFRRFVRGMVGGYYEEDQADFGLEPAASAASVSHGVHVIFETPNEDFLRGFRDYGLDSSGVSDFVSDTTDGTGSDYSSENEDAVYDEGGVVYLGPDDGVTFGYDFDDLHLFNLRFSELSIRHERWLGSGELMGQHLWRRDHGVLNTTPAWRFTLLGVGPVVDFGNLPVADIETPQAATKAEAGLFRGFRTVNYFAYGIRYNQSRDDIHWNSQIDGATGWGDLGATIRTRNSIIGPQIAFGRVTSKGRWMFDLCGMIQLAFQETKTTVRSRFGENIVTGGLNNSAVAEPTYSTDQRRDRDFAQHAEVRFTTSYFIRSNWSIDAMLRGFIAAPWFESQDRFVYTLPQVEVQSSDETSLVGGNLFLGVTYLR